MTLNYDFNVRSGELVDYISGMPSSKEILKAMDEISDAVGFEFLFTLLYLFMSLQTFFLTIYVNFFMYIIHNHVT